MRVSILLIFKLDKKKSSSASWTTAIEYWHKYKFPQDSSGNITIPDGSPQHSLSANGVVFSANVKDGGNKNGCGKITTDKATYKTEIGGPSYTVDYDGKDRVLTLHCLCIIHFKQYFFCIANP